MKAYLQLTDIVKKSIRDLQKLADDTRSYREQLLISRQPVYPWRTGPSASNNNQLAALDEETDEEEEDGDDEQEEYGGGAAGDGKNSGGDAAAGDQEGRQRMGNVRERNKGGKARGKKRGREEQEKREGLADAKDSDGDLMSDDPDEDDDDDDDITARDAAYEAATPLVAEALEGKQFTGIPLERKYTVAASLYANMKELESTGTDDYTYISYMKSWLNKQHEIEEAGKLLGAVNSRRARSSATP